LSDPASHPNEIAIIAAELVRITVQKITFWNHCSQVATKPARGPNASLTQT
jgi:hypothetical protein